MVTSDEKLLVELTRFLQYGEVTFAELDEDLEAQFQMSLTDAERNLILFVREGNPHLDLVEVHEGQPKYATVEGAELGFRYRKKRKL